MDAPLRQLLDFIEAQRPLHARRFPALETQLLLGFMCTTRRPGTHAAVAVCPLRRLEPGQAAPELLVRLRGPLPRAPLQGECVTVHLTRLEQYQGYQVKTAPLGAPSAASVAELAEERGGELTVKGRQTFTVHHSPFTMRFFEEIPHAELQETVGGERFALLAVGERANISPRFVWHVEPEGEGLALYHGDGLALKTYTNLRSNALETRLLLDLETYSGFALQGVTEEVSPQAHPQAWSLVQAGFEAGDWGRPSRMFRFRAERWQPIAPTGPALER